MEPWQNKGDCTDYSGKLKTSQSEREVTHTDILH